MVFTLSGTTVSQAFDTSSTVTLGLLNVKIDALTEVNSTVDTPTRTYTITSANPGTPFATPTLVVQDAPNNFNTLVNNVVAVAQQAEYQINANLIAGDVVGLTVAGTGVTQNFNTDKTTTLTALASQITSGTIVNASYSGATNKISFIAKTAGVPFSLSNLVIQSSGVNPSVVQPNVVPVAQVNTITLPRTIDAGEQMALTVAGTPIVQSYTGSSNATLDAFVNQIDSLAAVDASRSGGAITITSAIPGTPFAIGTLAVTGNSVAVVHVAPNVIAVAQQDVMSFARDFVAGDTLSGSVNGTPVNLSYSGSSAATLAALASAIDALPGVTATSNPGLKTVTVVAEAAGTPFTLGAFAIQTQVATTSVVANVVAKSQSETITFARNLVAGDNASIVINGIAVNQSYITSSNATLTAMTAAIDGLANVDASVSLGIRTITVTATTPGVSFSISSLNVINQVSPTVLQNPANPVKQISSYIIPNTIISGDQTTWTIAGQSLTGAFTGDDATSLNSFGTATDALGAVDATMNTGTRTLTVTAATAGNSFTTGNFVTTSTGVASTSVTTNTPETKASLDVNVVSAPLEGETLTIGSCNVTFSSVTLPDYDCSNNAAVINIASTDIGTIAALLRGLNGISDPVNGVITPGGTGTHAIFTRQTAQVGTTQINFVNGATPGNITSTQSTPVVAVTQSNTYTLPRTLVNGDSVGVTIDGTLFTQTYLADSTTTIANLASNIDSLPQLDATASGSVITITAADAGTAFTTGNLVITNTVTPTQSVSSSAGAVARQSITFPTDFVAGDAVAVDVNGTTVNTPFATDNATTILNVASNIALQPGVSATASGSNTVIVASTATGASLVIGTIAIDNSSTPTTLQANVAPVAQVDDYTLLYDVHSGQTVTATLSGASVNQAFTTDAPTTMTLLGGLIDNGTFASASYSGATKTLRLTAKTAGVGYTGSLKLDGESISPVNLVPNVASGAQVDQFTIPRTLVVGETLSVDVNAQTVTAGFATDTATTLANLAAAIDALPGVSAVSNGGASTITVTAEVAGIPFTLSALGIALAVPNTNIVPNVPAQAQIMDVTMPRNLVAGDTLTLPVGSGSVTTSFSGSEALTMSGFAAAIDAQPGVSATASGLVVTVTAEVAGIPFTLGNLSVSNTVAPTTTVNNVAPVAQVMSVNVPTFLPGDAVSLTVNGSLTAQASFATDSATTLTNLRTAIDGLGPVTTSMSGSTLILTANVAGTAFSVSTLSVINTQTATITAINVPPVSQIVTVTPSNTIKKWTFRVTVNATNYDYLSNALDTDNSVVTALAGNITASGVTATASGANLILTASIPGTPFTYSAAALDLTAPAITNVVATNEILRTGSTSTTSLSIDENGSIYFVQSGSTVATTGDLTALLLSGQAFLGKANALADVPYTFTIPAGVQDGHYDAIAIDASSNISGIHATGITIDNTPPLLTISTASGQTTNSGSFDIAGTTEAGLSVSISNTGSTDNVVALGNGAFSGNVALVLNAHNTIIVTATDAAGNTSTRTLTVTQDNINPVVSVTPATTVTNQATVAFTGTTEANANISITGGAATLLVTAASDGTFSGVVSLTANSLNTLLVTATDNAGNAGTGSMNVLQDSIVPTVILSTASGAIVDANTFQIDGITEANANIVITNQSGSTVGTATASSTGAFSTNATLLQDTTNILTVTATDAATNTASSAITVIEDSVANTLLISPQPVATSSNSITLTGSTKVGSSLVLTRNGGLTLTGSAAGGNYSFVVPLLPNSLNTISLTSTDQAMHVATGSVSITHDDINPAVVIATAAHTTSALAATLSGTTEAFASIVISGGSGAVVGGVADGSGAFSLVVPLSIGAANTLLVTATDLAGNVGTGSVVITQDPIPLTLTITQVGPITTSANTFTISGTSKANANIAVSGTASASTTVSGTGAYSVTLPLTANVTNNFLVTATDTSATLTGSIAVIQDSVAPSFTVSATGAITNALTYVLTGTTETGATVTATSSGMVSTIASGTGAYTLTLPLVTNTGTTFVVRATDLAGNVSTGTNVVITQDALAPAISAQSFSGVTNAGVTTGYYTFTTNETTTSTFYVGTGSNVVATTIWSGSTVGTSHSGAIVGVDPTNTYYVFVHSVDAAGNITDTPVGTALFAVASTNGGSNGGSSGGGGGGSFGSSGGGGSGGGSIFIGFPSTPSTPTVNTGTGTTTTGTGTTTTGTGAIGNMGTPTIKTPYPPTTPVKGTTKPIVRPTKPTVKPTTPIKKPTVPKTPIGHAVDAPGLGYVVKNGDAVDTPTATNGTNPVDYTFEGGARFISAANSVNVRLTPSMDGDLLATLPRNSRVELIGEQGVWGHVTFDGVDGWVYLDYLRTLQDSDIARTDPYLFAQGHELNYEVTWARVNAARYLNIRSKPDGDSPIVRSLSPLKHGELIVILDRLNGSEWVEIRSQKGTGYVRKKFIDEVE